MHTLPYAQKTSVASAAAPSQSLSPEQTFSKLAVAARDKHISTPCYLMDQAAFHRNGRILKQVQDVTGAKILLAQKAFACPTVYPILRNYLAGTAASGLHEARLGAEAFSGEVHVFSPAYTEGEMDALVEISDHIVFNSLSQWTRFRAQLLGASRPISAGLRVNPGYAEAVAEIYNPCAVGSRFGVIPELLSDDALEGIEGLHFHTLCEQGAEALERTLVHVVAKFDRYLKQMKWLNMGGGHLITNPTYNVDLLIKVIRQMQARYPHLEIYLEPGEAIAAGTGVLVGRVIDIVENGMQIAVLDVSATAHLPDVMEMPYRSDVEGAGQPGEKAHTYRLGAPTCLSGDVFGDYSFDQPLKIGDQVVFNDTTHYTMVKNTTFNGVRLPSIALLQEDGDIAMLREFGYEDYKTRLG